MKALPTVKTNSLTSQIFWLAVTFSTALCSIVYELILAQTLSSVMGNTAYRYNLTIGLYIAAMGIGALLVDKLSKQNQITYFLRVELLLAVVGTLAPWLVLMNDSWLQGLSAAGSINYFSAGVQLYSSLINNGLIVLVGFLSGLELPLLMRIGKDESINSSFKVLSMDYVGTTVGAALFPLVLFPNLNLFTMAYVFSLINLVTALMVAFKFKAKTRYLVVSFFLIGLALLLLKDANLINESLIKWFYLRGDS